MVAFAPALALLAALPSAFAASSRFVIKPAAFDNLCLTPTDTGNGRDVVVGPCTGDLIYWTTEGNTFVNGRANGTTNECLDERDGVAHNGSPMQIWECAEGNKKQQFSIVVNGTIEGRGRKGRWGKDRRDDGEAAPAPEAPEAQNTTVQLKWKDQDYCLDLKDGQGVAGNTVQIWRCAPDNINQKWAVYDVTEAPADASLENGDDSAAIYNAALAAYFAEPLGANATDATATESAGAENTDAATVLRRHRSRHLHLSH